MKIALINGAHPYSGIGKYAFNLFERLYRQGRDVDMLYCETPGGVLSSSMIELKYCDKVSPGVF